MTDQNSGSHDFGSVFLNLGYGPYFYFREASPGHHLGPCCCNWNRMNSFYFDCLYSRARHDLPERLATTLGPDRTDRVALPAVSVASRGEVADWGDLAFQAACSSGQTPWYVSPRIA